MALPALKKELVLPFSGRVAPNRTIKSAMSERLASFNAENELKRGEPPEELVHLYEVWGEGQIGMVLLLLDFSCALNIFPGIIIMGNIMMHPAHIESPGTHISGV